MALLQTFFVVMSAYKSFIRFYKENSDKICVTEHLVVSKLFIVQVPIIKMTDKETGIKVDISFNMTGGQSAARLIQVSTACQHVLTILLCCVALTMCRAVFHC